ncbi:TRAP transporter large permease [Paracoccus fistulariae]|uniref:TRAP transporter large permease subunit n=1 Tax=Paracoccus fistulariae TaxID=658446 RepID=A0ABY7SLQ9_9RHOB|nr:TRAP transporter large permease subunit [Paracoccus fistulariae]MDB6182598.1 TRAP transporter large permease subunit [Paracoccus fistulariae]WCR07804.1 TRAP transporter large permease subunit [Paracoccus fistulariae]
MTAFLIANIAPIMFCSLILLMLLGFPVAFALAANGILFALIGMELGLLSPSLLQVLPQRIFGIMMNDVLLALPFFTFMGLLLERSGMAEDLLETIGQLFGPIRGGLAFAVVAVGALLAATTGVVSASVISMGLISLPIMLRYGYDRSVATGVIAASGTLSQIIPPSLTLIILADQLGRPVGDMYQGAILPGLVLTGMYMAYVAYIAIIRPSRAPALPPDVLVHREANGRSGALSLVVVFVGAVAITWICIQMLMSPDAARDERIVTGFAIWSVLVFAVAVLDKMLKLGMLSKIASRTIFAMVPPLALIFLVLGTIFIGVATPTEGGAMGAMGALLLALLKGRLTLQRFEQSMESTMRLTSFAIFILVGSTIFALTFRAVNGDLWVEHLLATLPGGEWGFLIFVCIFVFIAAFFLDFFELAFIVIPLLGPVAESMGIDMVWFGVIIAVNMQTSFMHPPFGLALFYLRSVAPHSDYKDAVTGQTVAKVTTGQIYRGSIPFICIQIAMVALVLAVPQMVTHYKASHDADVDPATVEIRFDGPDYGADSPFN